MVASLAGKHVINFQMAVEICFLFGKTIILLLSDRVSVISFAGFSYFLLNRELFRMVRLHNYILLHFTFEFSGGAILFPCPKVCSNAPFQGHNGRSNGSFPRAFLKKRLIKLEFTEFGNAILT